MTLELPDWAGAMLEREPVARLGFRDDEGLPRVLPVTYALADDAVWSAIDRKPKSTPEPVRVRWLRERPQAALVVDHYERDWTKLAWIQLLGRVDIVDASDAPAALEALARKYGGYRAEPPPGPLLRLDVDRALCWRAADG
jgi:PPOX class probable F420-dependent enzyme